MIWDFGFEVWGLGKVSVRLELHRSCKGQSAVTMAGGNGRAWGIVQRRGGDGGAAGLPRPSATPSERRGFVRGHGHSGGCPTSCAVATGGRHPPSHHRPSSPQQDKVPHTARGNGPFPFHWKGCPKGGVGFRARQTTTPPSYSPTNSKFSNINSSNSRITCSV